MLANLRHFFFPNHTNNFKAKALHVDFFLLYALVFLAIGLVSHAFYRLDPNILGFATDIRVDQLLKLTNQKRAVAGEPALKLNNQLSQAAVAKANYMFAHNFWAHNAPDGTTPWDFINHAGYVYTIAGENLAKNFSNSEGVVDAWMNSASHRENLLRNQYEEIGFAVVNGVLNGEETTLVVQMFGKSLATAPTSQLAQASPPPLLPPATVAQAGETSGLQFLSEVASPIPVATVAPKEVVITDVAPAVVKKPLIDIGQFSKNVSVGLFALLMVMLVIDGVYIWHRKIVRVGGKNLAHLIFLGAITGAIWLATFGRIL